ncbi:MAG TPA: phosphotransferase, partial [Anaerolineaceae bacterium]
TYYTQTFPERPGARIADLNCLNNGWESDVYAFRVDWDGDNGRQSEELILRIYPGGDAAQKSAGEFRALSLLKKVGYPVPRVDRLEVEHSPFGQPFLIMEAIQGRSMWGIMFHAMPWRQPRYLAQFCGLLARLHAIDWRPYVPNPDEFEPGGDYAIVDKQIDRWRPFFDAMPMPGFISNLEWLTAHQHDVISRKASLIHWDFHPNNILLKANGEAIVIDWTGLDVSDYRFDLAWTLLLIASTEGHRWRARLLRAYERQAGHPVEDMEFFIAAGCFRRLYSVIASVAYGPDKLGMRPGAEAQMRQHARPLRYVYSQLQAITGQPIPEVEDFLVANKA